MPRSFTNAFTQNMQISNMSFKQERSSDLNFSADVDHSASTYHAPASLVSTLEVWMIKTRAHEVNVRRTNLRSVSRPWRLCTTRWDVRCSCSHGMLTVVLDGLYFQDDAALLREIDVLTTDLELSSLRNKELCSFLDEATTVFFIIIAMSYFLIMSDQGISHLWQGSSC